MHPCMLARHPVARRQTHNLEFLWEGPNYVEGLAPDGAGGAQNHYFFHAGFSVISLGGHIIKEGIPA